MIYSGSYFSPAPLFQNNSSSKPDHIRLTFFGHYLSIMCIPRGTVLHKFYACTQDQNNLLCRTLWKHYVNKVWLTLIMHLRILHSCAISGYSQPYNIRI